MKIKKLITESDINSLLSQNNETYQNQFKFYPKKVYITDSYNNPLYPYTEIVLDKYTFDLPEYKRYLEKEVFGQTLEFLPFHFWIEYVDNDYYVFNTRPLYLKPIITDKKYSEINDSYLIVICGNTNRDIYPYNFQMKLYRLINSLYRLLVKINPSITKHTFLNTLHIDINKILSHELQTKITNTS